MTRALQKISARRSAAARKGWETRRENARLVLEVKRYAVDPVAFYNSMVAIPAITRGVPPDPNPWPRVAAWVKRMYLRATGWLR